MGNSICCGCSQKKKSLIDLKIKHQTVPLLKDNIGENLDDLRNDDDILDIRIEEPSIKEITDKLDFFKIKKSALRKTLSCNGKQATDWEEIIAKNLSGKDMLCKIYKEHSKVNNKKINSLVTKSAEGLIKD